MDVYKTNQDQEKIERKAKRYALLLLLLLLMVLFFPFFSGKLQTEQSYNKIITVIFEEDFKESAASARKSSARPAAESKELKVPEDVAETEEEPQEEVKEEPPKKPERKPMAKLDPVPLTKSNDRPLLTTSEPNLSLPEVIGKISERAQVQEVSEEMTEVTEEVSEEFMKEVADFFKKSKKASGKKKSSASGQKSDAGEGDAGSSTTGDAKTDGVGDSGDEGPSFDGDGLLTRKVVKRANLSGLIQKTGKIVINLCVNQDGKVVFTKADRTKSTIRDLALLKQAENTAAQYKYEKDYTVAERQCGKLSFVVTIQK